VLIGDRSMDEARAYQSILDALDPVQLFTKNDLTPDTWQVEVLRSTHKRILLNCSRQSGKSLTAAALAAHTALYQPGSLTLLISVAQRQSAELFRVVRNLLRHPEVLTDAPPGESLQRIELPNGSRILSLPGQDPDTIRGFAGVSMLVIDEASRTSDALYAAAKPMLAVSGGRLIALSTPNGRRGWWAQAWFSDSQDWLRVRVPAGECPRITAEFLREERLSLGDAMYAQEYETEFIDDTFDVFNLTLFENMLIDEPAWNL